MRVSSIMPSVQPKFVKNETTTESMSIPISGKNNIDLLPMNGAQNVVFNRKLAASQGISYITFTGNTDRNVNQVLSLAYENKGTGLPEDFQGGMGVVTFEAPQSMIKHENIDVRSIMPFHEYNNPNGGLRYVNIGKLKEKFGGKLPDRLPVTSFVPAMPGTTVEDVAKGLYQDPKDLRVVIQSEPNSKGLEGTSKYVILEPTSAKGVFERMSDTDIGAMQKVEYQLFKISEDNPKYNKIKDTPNYFMYTRELAKTPKPYTYGIGGADGMDAEINNADFCRAVLKAEQQMDTEEFGHFKPASIWGHDRPVAMITSFIADESARGNDNYNGVISHHTLHNPGVNYQGHTDNPFAFARAIFSKEDVEAIKKHPQYELLQNFNERGWNNLREPEKKFVRAAFDPFIGVFKDYFNTYNITKVPIVAKMMNPDNFSIGTVSRNFDKEMKALDMDVAQGIGADLRDVKTISPLNGSTPASLGFDNNTDDFGRGGNTLSKQKDGFTPIKYNGKNIKEVIVNRQRNAKWLTGILANAEKEGQDALNHVFFNDLQIEQGRSVFGSLSEFKQGDMLFMGWGRPDEQKGYPITFDGFLNFLKRDDVPKEIKLKTKLIVGAGDAPWNKDAKDFKLIMKALDEIQQLDGGAYKHNAMYVDGFFPNKLVTCATHGIFTSRREMCGITPLEAKAAGAPYIATATGGMVDYTNETNGWKTKSAPEMNPDFDGLDWNTPQNEIDDARIRRSAEEVSDCFKEATEEFVNRQDDYVAKCKKNIEEHLDWHNNAEFNGGKSANQSYKNDIWHIDEEWEARNKSPMRRLVGADLSEATGKISETVKEVATEVEETAKSAVKDSSKKIRNKWTKTMIGTGVAIAALGTVAYAYMKHSNKQMEANKAENKQIDKTA